jgi:hypothetical protein
MLNYFILNNQQAALRHVDIFFQPDISGQLFVKKYLHLPTMNTNTNAPSNALEQRLQQKLEEYNLAEQSGKNNNELAHIYKEIKDIRYQLTISKLAPRV